MPVTPAPDPRTVLDAVVFRIGDAPVTRVEIRRWAERFDPSFVARVARRAALGGLDLAEDASINAEAETEASEFRYARELESAESLVEWIAAQGITVESWWEAIRRSVLERRYAGQRIAGRDAGAGEADPDDEAGVRVADLVVADLRGPAAEALARRFAVARAVAQWSPVAMPVAMPVASPVAYDDRHDALERIWSDWRSALTTEEALQQAVSREPLSWLVLDLVQSDWSSVDAAREAVSCVLVDGGDLEEVARAAGVGVEERSCLLAEVPDALHDALLTAAPGDVVGPIALPPRWVVARLLRKRVPSLREPLVRAAAARDLESRSAAPFVEQQVVWSERVK